MRDLPFLVLRRPAPPKWPLRGASHRRLAEWV